jgi:hypothetical protein
MKRSSRRRCGRLTLLQQMQEQMQKAAAQPFRPARPGRRAQTLDAGGSRRAGDNGTTTALRPAAGGPRPQMIDCLLQVDDLASLKPASRRTSSLCSPGAGRRVRRQRPSRKASTAARTASPRRRCTAISAPTNCGWRAPRRHQHRRHTAIDARQRNRASRPDCDWRRVPRVRGAGRQPQRRAPHAALSSRDARAHRRRPPRISSRAVRPPCSDRRLWHRRHSPRHRR